MSVSSLSLDCVSITKISFNYKVLCSSRKPLKAVGVFEEAVHKKNGTVSLMILSHDFFLFRAWQGRRFPSGNYHFAFLPVYIKMKSIISMDSLLMINIGSHGLEVCYIILKLSLDLL